MARNAPTSRAEAGLSLVELVVAMLVLAIVMGMITQVFGDALTTKDAVTSDASATTTANQLIDEMSDDLRAVLNSNRSASIGDDILKGANGATDIRDVILATPYELEARGDVSKDHAGMECVHYLVDAEGSTWRLVSKDWLGCSSAVSDRLSLARIVPGAGAKNIGVVGVNDAMPFDNKYPASPVAGGPAASVLFTYVLANQVGGPTSTDCTPKPQVGAVNGNDELARIMAIDVSVQPSVTGRNSVGNVVVRDRITLRSRAVPSYWSAIGCEMGLDALTVDNPAGADPTP